MRQVEPNGAGRRPLAHDDIEREVLERWVQDFLDHAVHAVDLVDEQDIALFEVGENGGQVTSALDGRTARRLYVRMKFVSHHGGERRLAKARRTREQDVVDRLATLQGCLNHDGERLFHFLLPKIVFKILGSEAAVER